MLRINKLFTLFIIVMAFTACQNNVQKPADPVEEKIQGLIAQMTLEEKLGQLVQTNYSGNPEDWEEELKNGKIGSFLNLSNVETANEVQRIAVEESRLGIPLLFGRDVIHGFKTIFPIPLGLASSWSPEYAEKSMEIAAREASAYGINWTFAPMIDVTWDPRWGRIAETCGEDPYLTSLLGAAMVRGYQGDDPSEDGRIAACAKHYIGYGMSEAGRDYNTTYIPETKLRNVHLRPFQAAINTGCLTVMSAFNDLNGVPTTGNYYTLKTILRDELGFDGMVVSDWASIEQQVIHGYTETPKEAALKSIVAGVDMEMASRTYDFLGELIDEGEIDESLINERVANILRVKIKLGLFDNPYTDESLQHTRVLSNDHLEYAREVSRNSMVLLKNEKQTLPLEKSQKVALIGPLTNAPHDQMGTWVFDGDEKNSITPLTAFKEVLGNKLNYAVGLEYSRDNSKAGFTAAIAAAKKSDVIVFIGGEESSLSGEANCRGILNLPGIQEELLSELAKLNKPLVLVVMAGRPLGIGEQIDQSDAVLYAWHPGTMAGPALTDLIFGDYSPSGKLPVTFVKGAGQIPLYYYHKNTGKPTNPDNMTLIDDIPRNSKQLSLGFTSLHIDYGIDPLYPFGYGLTYTSFEYSNLKLSSDQLSMDGTIEASCTITNTGNYTAKEIVQLYVRDHFGSITRPVKELKGFQNITLIPGESKIVTFTISPNDLEFHNGEKYVIEPGKFNLWIAKDSASGEYEEFTLVGST
jgi:beta-glucosidase